MKTFWLSFVDTDRGFLGVAVLDVTEADAVAAKVLIDRLFPQHRPGAEWVAAAQRRAWQLGCNPAGQVQFTELPPDHPDTARVPRNRLMQKAELIESGFFGRVDC
jgi:hypothetical protein